MVTATTEEIIQQLVRSPRLPQVTRQFQAILKAEQAKRQRFYEEMSETAERRIHQRRDYCAFAGQTAPQQRQRQPVRPAQRVCSETRIGLVGHEKLLVTLTRNDYEPDICYFGSGEGAALSPGAGRNSRHPISWLRCLSKSTEAVDRGIKFEDYALHGVAEYWIVDPEQESVEQYLLQDELTNWRSKSNPA